MERSNVVVIQNTLYFYDASEANTISCNCIKEPFASKIVELFKRARAEALDEAARVAEDDQDNPLAGLQIASRIRALIQPAPESKG